MALRLALVFLLLFPAAFMALEADHDCSGADCAVCQCIQAGESLLDSIGSAPASAVVPATPLLLLIALLASAGCVSNSSTLIQQKVRLDI